MKISTSLPLLALLFHLPFSALAQDNDPELLAAEQARGILTGDTGVQWTVNVKSEGADGNRTAKFVSISQNGKIYAEVMEPAEAEGRRYLAESDGKMWFWKPGLSRPVSVSKRQRLSGDAAIGDIASTSYVDGYSVESREDGEVDGETATVYTMKANSLGDTYKQIKYWVTKKGNLGKKAEFFASSGTLLRTATMVYGNSANGGPFLSQMVIQDNGKTVTLNFSEVEIGQFPDDLFDREKMGGGVTRAKTKNR
ncbi:MAG: outer membrane lipoprotein-sorting protein [Verrucomicrobiae bacterium]|nr:outer membrane lipoprotein-sorting protein [Verrucomicrobiae bacterium]